MAVHCIRIYAEDDGSYTEQEVQDSVKSWADQHTEWLEDNVAHEIERRNTDSLDQTGTPYFRAEFRFEASDDLTTLLDDAESILQQYVGWYRLAYHQCEHDGSGGCESWDANSQREYNADQIPSGVPNYE